MFRKSILSEDGKVATIKKFEGFGESDPKIAQWLEANADRVGTACIIDTETTGLGADDEVIEVALRLFNYDKETLRFAQVSQTKYEGLQQPTKPISEKITEITGITNEDVAGKSIDWDQVSGLLEGADFILAHNASFDRPMVEKYCQIAKEKRWCCSLEQIDWKERGFPVKKQEILGVFHGFFYDAHRALMDVDALAKLISDNEEGYLKELIGKSKTDHALVKAIRSDFESKDLLKENGFRWDGSNKYWYKKVDLEEVDELKIWLKENAYRKNARNFDNLSIETILSINNFRRM